MIKAKWVLDYDLRTAKKYSRPKCPECYVPIVKDEDGKYRCRSCRKKVAVDKEMKEWIEYTGETKVEMEDCIIVKSKNGRTMGCGGKNCVKTLYRRNPATMKWEVAISECEICGQKIIV